MSASILRIDFTVDLSPISAEVAKFIPRAFNEHGHPESSNFRWDLRLLSGPNVLPVAGGRLSLTASYYGDLETIGTFPGCHLGSSPGVYDPNESWVYVDLNVSGKPTVALSAGTWSIALADIQTSVALGPNSDTKCSVFNVDVGEKLNQLLGSAAVSQAITQAVQRLTVPISLAELWSKANAPGRIPLDSMVGSQQFAVCVALNLSRIDVEQMHGTTRAVTVPLAFYLDPQITATTAATCPPGTSTGTPNVVVK